MKIIEAAGLIRDLLETIEQTQVKIYKYSGRKGITRISIDSELGLNHGLIPGTTAILCTSVGFVELYCERRLDIEFERHRWRTP
jgi:hypothetical protein